MLARLPWLALCVACTWGRCSASRADPTLEEEVLFLQLTRVLHSGEDTLLREFDDGAVPYFNVSDAFLANQTPADNTSAYGRIVDFWAQMITAKTEREGPVEAMVADYRFLTGYWLMWPSMLLFWGGFGCFVWILAELVLQRAGYEMGTWLLPEESEKDMDGTPHSSASPLNWDEVNVQDFVIHANHHEEAFKRASRSWYDQFLAVAQEKPKGLALAIPPAPTAADQEQTDITYEDLQKVVENYARALRDAIEKAAAEPSLGNASASGAGMVFGVAIDRSPEYVALLLAASKVGVRSMLLPPSYPQQRLRAIVDAAQPTAVCSVRGGFTIMGFEKTLPLLPFQEAAKASCEPCERSDDPALGGVILSSSGSTGTPKLISRSERSFAHRLSWTWVHLPLEEGEHCVQKSFVATTHSLYELLEPLLAGNPVHILPDVNISGVHTFWKSFRLSQAKRLLLVPSLLSGSLSDGGGMLPGTLKIVVLMGEAPQPDVCKRLVKRLPNIQIFSVYGCTEASSAMQVNIKEELLEFEKNPALAGRGFSLGKPIHPQVKLQVLDESGQPLAEVGGMGTLHFSGPHLFDEYLAAPELTQTSRSDDDDGHVWYNTHDRVEILEGGLLRHLGRADDLVKIRGNRMQLEEVEHHLTEFPGVHQACVLLEDSSDTLMAYVCPDTVDRVELRQFLSSRVPPYMIPKLICLDAMPTLPNGKVDRVTLRQWLMGWRIVTGAAAPKARSPKHIHHTLDKDEDAVLSAIEEITGVRPSPDDHLADMGMDSISVLRLSVGLRKSLGVRIPDLILLQNPTVAQVIEASRKGHFKEDVAVNLDTISGLRFVMSLAIMQFHWLSLSQANILKNPESMQQWRPMVFMVLAGALLSIKHNAEESSTWKMFLSNVPQIFPVYWLALLIDAPVESTDFNWSFMSVITVLCNVTMTQFAWPGVPSLQFYGVIPAYYVCAQILFVLLFNPTHRFIKWQIKMSRYAVARIVMLGLAAATLHTILFIEPVRAVFDWYGSVSGLNPIRYLPLFGLGSITGQAILNVKLTPFQERVGVITADLTVLLILYEALHTVGIIAGPSIGFPLMSLVALWVFLLCRTPCITAKVLASPYVSHGELSFVIYMLHYPIITWVLFCNNYQIDSLSELLDYPWFTAGSTISAAGLPPWTFLGTALSIILISMIVTWSVHQPLQRTINRYLAGQGLI